jgi:hypothetical protein
LQHLIFKATDNIARMQVKPSSAGSIGRNRYLIAVFGKISECVS